MTQDDAALPVVLAGGRVSPGPGIGARPVVGPLGVLHLRVGLSGRGGVGADVGGVGDGLVGPGDVAGLGFGLGPDRLVVGGSLDGGEQQLGDVEDLDLLAAPSPSACMAVRPSDSITRQNGQPMAIWSAPVATRLRRCGWR